MIDDRLDTGLFSSRGEERLSWSHQTLAEYLAARYCLTHGLSFEQLRSLIFYLRRARVIPQVREVASWLALQNEGLFLEIAQKDPEVVLGSAAPSLSPYNVASSLTLCCVAGTRARFYTFIAIWRCGILHIQI